MKAARHLRSVSAICALAFAAASCIYPFEPEIESKTGMLVVEGDILIGEISTVELSCIYAMGFDAELDKDPKAYVTIEGEDGGKYSDGILSSMHRIDLGDAPDNTRYRLVIDRPSNGHHYHSEWKEVQKPAAIDEISHSLAKSDYDPDGMVAISFSMIGTGSSSRYYRWSYDETWEFHSSHRATHQFIPGSSPYGYDVMRAFEGGENTYYCWATEKSHQIMIFSTENQSVDRYENLAAITHSRRSNKLQEVYKLTVHLQALDHDGFRYWKNTHENSNQTGNLLAPMPSSMRGNISCEEDPEEMIFGYISAARRTSRDMYIDNNTTHYFIPVPSTEKSVYVYPLDWRREYSREMRPYTYENIGGQEVLTWLPARCVDCRYSGTKNKPEGWPRPEI